MFWKEEIDFLAYIIPILLGYWVFVFLSSLLNDPKKRLLYLFIGGVFFSVLFSLRDPSIGNDAANYASLVTSPGLLQQKIEPFFLFLAWLVRFFGGNEYVYFFLISLLINVFLLKAFYIFNKNRFHLYYLFFITSFLFINMNMNIMRQGVAISFTTLAIAYYYSKAYLKFLFLIIAAILTHVSSAIILLVPLFGIFNFKPQIIKTLILGLIILYFVKLSTFIQPFTQYGFFLDKLYWYLTWDKIIPFKLKHVYYLFLILFLVVTVRYFRDFNNYNLKISFNSLLSVFLIVTLFREDEFLVDRSVFYYYPLIVITVLNLVDLFNKKFNKDVVLYSMVFGSLIWLGQSLYQFYSWWILGNIR